MRLKIGRILNKNDKVETVARSSFINLHNCNLFLGGFTIKAIQLVSVNIFLFLPQENTTNPPHFFPEAPNL